MFVTILRNDSIPDVFLGFIWEVWHKTRTKAEVGLVQSVIF